MFKNEDHQTLAGFDLGGNSTADVFHNAGVVILTDSIVGRSDDGGRSCTNMVLSPLLPKYIGVANLK